MHWRIFTIHTSLQKSAPVFLSQHAVFFICNLIGREIKTSIRYHHTLNAIEKIRNNRFSHPVPRDLTRYMFTANFHNNLQTWLFKNMLLTYWNSIILQTDLSALFVTILNLIIFHVVLHFLGNTPQFGIISIGLNQGNCGRWAFPVVGYKQSIAGFDSQDTDNKKVVKKVRNDIRVVLSHNYLLCNS